MLLPGTPACTLLFAESAGSGAAADAGADQDGRGILECLRSCENETIAFFPLDGEGPSERENVCGMVPGPLTGVAGRPSGA